MKTYFIPGFLGGSHNLKHLTFFCNEAFDLKNKIDSRPRWQELVISLNDWLNQRKSGKSSKLIAYSMGGRLLRSLIQQKPEILSQYEVVLVSTHLGYYEAEEISYKKNFNEIWIEKFTNMGPDEGLKAWNQLELFTGEPSINTDSNWSLDNIIWALEEGSHVESPIDLRSTKFIYGSQDLKYKKQCERAINKDMLRNFKEIPNRRHRCIFV